MENSGILKTYIALSAAVIFWGLSFVATKMAIETIPLFTLVFTRFFIASVILFIFIRKLKLPPISKKIHARILLLALFEPGLYFIFETLGLKYTAAPKASLIIATIPLFVSGLAFLLIGEKISLVQILGIGISFLGIGIIVTGDPKFTWNMEGPLLGDILIFGAVFSASLYMISARNLGKTISPISITALQFLYGAIFFFPAFLWELPSLNFAKIYLRSLGAMIYLIFFATIIAFICYNYALSKIPASKVSVFINFIPVVTAVGAWALIGETLTLLQIIGGSIVLFAVCLTNFNGAFRKSGKKPGEICA